MARLISLTILSSLIVFLGITFFRVIAPFLLPLFLAGVVTVLCQPIHRYFLCRTNNRARVSAGLTTATVLAMFLVPLLFGIFIGSVQLYLLTQETIESGRLSQAVTKMQQQLETQELLHNVEVFLLHFEGFLPKDFDQKQAVNQFAQLLENVREQLKTVAERSLGTTARQSLGIAGKTLDKTFGILGAAVSHLVALLMFTIALYYFLADGPALLSAAEELIPVHSGYQRELLQQFDKVVRAVVLATFLAAIGQGLATSMALYSVGWHVESDFLRNFFFFFVISTFASLIPLSGTWLVWAPCAFWLVYQGHWGSAFVLTLFGAVVIGMMDNIIRTYILQSDAKLHPLLAFVSVLGGLQVMGLWGVFIGPIVACCLHALIQIFNTELKEFSKDRLARPAAFGSPQEKQADIHSDVEVKSVDTIPPDGASRQTTDASSANQDKPR